MRPPFNFRLGNRCLLEEELGLVERVNASLLASAVKHGIPVKVESLPIVKWVKSHNGTLEPRVGSLDSDPVDLPLAMDWPLKQH